MLTNNTDICNVV